MTPLHAPGRILITGATGGLGMALARHYAAPGRTLYLQGRSPERLLKVCRDCAALGATTESLQFDLQSHADLTAWKTYLAALPPFDLAIVNAGVTSNIGARAEGETWQSIVAVLDINLYSALATVDAVLPAMRARQSGQIGLVSSIAAWYGLPLTPAYCASKAGLKAYGEALRGWLAPEGIAVNVILPGFIETHMSDRFPGPRPFRLAPAHAATRIAVGLRRNRARISFPFPLNVSMWALALLPSRISQRLLQWTGFGRPGERQRND